ncbi:intradiol ring-cleavage dioxygenase [Chitinophaga solisilvae]|uniref:dioxygenase family protein n=1 Tax=Chitinophaga solisilvae TaxID=1233460 RepID=UPI00136CD2F8|nr:intradiol ring-cleavage dioxygenase [Chitinophaga solisilvae]
MKTIMICLLWCASLLHLQSCPGQLRTKKPLVGGGCDGCELMYTGMPRKISATDTSAGWYEKGQRLVISGTVFRRNARQPAPGVIIYYWQTDNNGYYAPRPGMDASTRRHGHIRGWVKTDTQGRYTICTIRPQPYPGEDMPAHIHLSVKEPGINEYYVDEFVFDDDPLLTKGKRQKLENRGGSGILKPALHNGLWKATHHMQLGLHIPGYPEQ